MMCSNRQCLNITLSHSSFTSIEYKINRLRTFIDILRNEVFSFRFYVLDGILIGLNK